MKRLIISKKDSQGQPRDEWLGKPIEIINTESKLYAFRGIVDKLKNGKYTLLLNPEPYENTNTKHRIYVQEEKMYKWVRILPEE